MVSPTSMGPNHRLAPWPVRVLGPLMLAALAAAVLEKVDAFNSFCLTLESK